AKVLRLGKESGTGLPAVEERHLVAARERDLDRVPPQELRAAEGQDAHGGTVRDSRGVWVMFHVPCPTPDGQTAEQLYRKRLDWITPEMQPGAWELGCTV